MSVQISEKTAETITIMPDNRIQFLSKDGQKMIDLNQMYEGYYPFCRFTDAVVCADHLYVAGTDPTGVPHIYSSRKGEVWSPVPISPQKSWITEKDYGDIVKILFDSDSAQLFLITYNGYLVTLPDCPKCVRARHISDQPLVDGRIDAKKIVMTDAAGGVVSYSLYMAVQYRCVWSFAQPHIGKDGIVIDLRNGTADQLPGAIRGTLGDVDLILDRLPREVYLFFVCEYGRKADEAVRDARSMGFQNSYSLGDARSVWQEIQAEAVH